MSSARRLPCSPSGGREAGSGCDRAGASKLASALDCLEVLERLAPAVGEEPADADRDFDTPAPVATMPCDFGPYELSARSAAAAWAWSTRPGKRGSTVRWPSK